MRGRMTLGDRHCDCSIMLCTNDYFEEYYYDDEPIEIVTNRSVYMDVLDHMDGSRISVIMTADQAKAIVKGLKMQIKRCGR